MEKISTNLKSKAETEALRIRKIFSRKLEVLHDILRALDD